MISLPALESPHSGGEGEELLSLCNSVQRSAAVHTCAASVQNKQYELNLYIYHISVTLGFSYILLGVMFLLPQLKGCAISPQMTPFGGCDTGTVSSLKDACVGVCARVRACWRAGGQTGGGGGRRAGCGGGGGSSSVITCAWPG